VFGAIDGIGGNARFFTPGQIAIASNGDVYVSDSENHTIRRITPSGLVMTFAGSPGQAGDSDGQGGAARFNLPAGLAIDVSGNVYVADTRNHTIRRISPDGAVVTVAGLAGNPGAVDGTGTAARFDSPQGIEIDAAGMIWIADTNNFAIRRMTPAGDVITYAGGPTKISGENGHISVAGFGLVSGIVADGAGNLYTVENGAQVRKIDRSAEQVSTLAQQTPGLTAQWASIAIDRDVGAMYIVDASNYRVLKVSLAGEVRTLLGTPGQGRLVSGTLPGAVPYLYGVAARSGVLYVTGEDGIARVTNVP
jgi:sugar lactone lactonase YvrE